MTDVLCIYHANCADGLGAAWAVHRALGDDVEFVAAKYGEDPPTGIEGRDVLIVDFSYPIDVLRAMAAEARSVLVIDHHKTAQEGLRPICSMIQLTWRALVGKGSVWPNDALKLAAIFDLDRSGAGLTWDYLHLGASRPQIIDLIEDRDLWRFNHDPWTREFHASLMRYYGGVATEECGGLASALKMLDVWHELSTRHEDPGSNKGALWRGLLDEGRAIVDAQQKLVEDIVRTTRRTIKIAGHVVPVANVPGSMASEAGHLLCQAEVQGSWIEPSGHYVESEIAPSFSATYHDGADGKRHFSLRSPEGGADVGRIAQEMAKLFNAWATRDVPKRAFMDRRWTGGGHEHAAGFDAPIGWEGE